MPSEIYAANSSFRLYSLHEHDADLWMVLVDEKRRHVLLLDGKFKGSFPSGTASPGGDFVITFEVS